MNNKEKTHVSKRMNYEIPVEIHRELKMIALKRNITLKELMFRLIDKHLKENRKYN